METASLIIKVKKEVAAQYKNKLRQTGKTYFNCAPESLQHRGTIIVTHRNIQLSFNF